MRRLIRLVLIAGLAALPAATAQESKEPEKSESSKGGEGGLEVWKWANFILLAGGLGYLAGKHGGPFFAARSKQIRQDMTEAEAMRAAAEARAAEMVRRLASLESDILALRDEARVEAEAEDARVKLRCAAETAKIQAHAEQEIASAAKAARAELKRYVAQLAVELAEGKIRAGMTPAAQDALVEGFVRDLAPTSSKPRTN